jgi:putative DNA primase/helicase
MTDGSLHRVELVIHEGDKGRGDPPPPPPGDGDGDEPGLQPVPLSDDQLTQQFSDKVLRDDSLFVASEGKWRTWDGRRWAREETLQVLDQARELCRRQAQGLDDKRLARAISGEPTIRRVEKLARAMRRHAVLADAFDADLWRLNTPHGIVDLRTGQLFPHDRGALMTKLTAVGPEAVAECPTWLRVLGEATGGNAGLIAYLQRVFGYSLVGVVTEHVVVIFHGRVGGEGKTLILGTIAGAMGDYATPAPMDTFTVTQGERHSTELAGLAGARLVIASEIGEDRRWDEAKLKAISGGDKITARFMRGDFFSFFPQFTLVIGTNHLPQMRSAAGMRRRLQVVPFLHRPAVPDPELPEKLKAEWPGILAWMIEGAVLWQRMGLAPPPVVVDATAEYFERESAVGLWLEERCVKDPAAEEATRALHRDFQSWAARAGERSLSERKFAQKLAEVSGLANGKVHKRTARGFFGVALQNSTGNLYGGGARRPVGGGVLRANEMPGEPIDDPAEDFDR